MLWFGLVPVTAACLTRITPDPEVPLRGHLGALQINLESCWKPCLLSGPICYPLCPAHTITAAESQAKVKHVMDVLGREELQRKSRDEEKRRLAIRYPFEVSETSWLWLILIFRRRLDEQKKREKIQGYWSNLHSTSLEETQPFIKGFLIVALLVVVAALVAEYAYTLDWSSLFGWKKNRKYLVSGTILSHIWLFFKLTWHCYYLKTTLNKKIRIILHLWLLENSPMAVMTQRS